MQKCLLNYLIFLLSLSFVNAQSPAQLLAKGDSLFAKKKYAEAFISYKELYGKGDYTAQMLLKMAYVKEGLGEVADALYYLNIYYVNFPQRGILRKMDSLAKTKEIEGYNYDDVNYFLFLYYRHKSEIMIGMVGVLFLFFLAIVSNRVLFKRIPITSPYLFLALAALVYLFVNYSSHFFYKGIVMNTKAIVMDAPSAGAHVLTTLPKGTRVHVWGDEDVWYQVSWQGKTAFIRKSNMNLTLARDEKMGGKLFGFL